MRTRWAAWTGLLIAGCGLGSQSVNLNPPKVPDDVSVPAAAEGTPADMLPYFDDYSWQAFLALVRPAAAGQRGAADEHLTVTSDQKPKVFETFKAMWEVLHGKPDGTLDADHPVPAPWRQYDQGSFNACGVDPKFGDLVLASFSGWSDLGQGFFGALNGPLVAQNGTYVHYWTGYNEVEFEQIAKSKAYLPTSPGTTFPTGSLSVKASWMDMAHIAHPERYYTRNAWVRDPNDAIGHCEMKPMGLVGLHIAQKTHNRLQWIWSTFEQVDNVPDDPPDPLGSTGTYNFHRNGVAFMKPGNPYPAQPIGWPPPPPQNVNRVKHIHPLTQTTNLAYRKALQAAGSVWQNYQLVMTQFAIKPDQTGPDTATPDYTFPGTNNAGTAFANSSIETYEQGNIGDSCMACHLDTNCEDFVCSIKIRTSAVPPVNMIHVMPVDSKLSKEPPKERK
ncbi:MAG TPA: hypothetical protein VLW65_03350 [Bryobacteraceae bacterium]|nr:hypothetical protein [Bryobacteraceae bacterium]